MEIWARNVNEALAQGARLFAFKLASSRLVSPRGKDTLEIDELVTTIYTRPWERVLFSQYRDANPFLHFFESLWLLAGRDDIEFVTFLNKRFADYSDDGKVMQGSYGVRWRKWYTGNRSPYMDQLAEVIELLKRDPETRRAVLEMWDPTDLVDRVTSRDIPCNTHVYFKLRDNSLRMTVCCRSNDMIWGAYGANAVQFSMLHEYVANKIGAAMGVYTQVSDSFHVYLNGPEGDVWERVRAASKEGWLDGRCPYSCGGLQSYSLGAEEPEWDKDMKRFFDLFDNHGPSIINPHKLETVWWAGVAVPMWNAFVARSENELDKMLAKDWRLAAAGWLRKHVK